MGLRSAKTTAIIFIVLFLGYYQRWLYVPIFEAISGRLSIDPAVPSLLENFEGDDNPRNDKGPLGKSIIYKTLTGQSTGPLHQVVDPMIQEEADKLSQIIQRDLEVNQRGQNLKLMARGCQQPKLICGSPMDCGLGCQIHYVMTCLMISYVTNRTLILNWENWPYQPETFWNDIFLPVGIGDCLIDNDTATVIWTRSGIDISYPDMTSYPYKSGVPVPLNIAKKLKKLPSQQFIWWQGQFAKFTMRLQLAEEELMKKLRHAVKFHLPTVGILYRRRDKLSEKKKSNQAIDRYMTTARKYFTKLEELIPNLTRRVYIATDDRNVVRLVRKRYRPPKWEILGFQLKSEAEDLTKDIYLLSECDYVICSFSSDICRLVLELKESRNLNSSDRVKSLDQKYFYSGSGLAYKKLNFN